MNDEPIEQGLKVFTSIYKRIHRAAKAEYDKLYRLNRVYLDEQFLATRITPLGLPDAAERTRRPNIGSICRGHST
jgi:hypothetical protein